MNAGIIKKECQYQGLNYSLYTDGKTHPLLFFFHGFTSNRQIGIMGRGEILANLGFTVVAFDAPLHGDRSNDAFSKLSSSDKQKQIIDIVIENALDAKALYDHHLQFDRLIKQGPVYAFGVSMGAQVSFYLGTIMPLLQTLITLVGSPSFYDFYEWKRQKYEWPNNEEFQKKQSYYKSIDPLIHYEKLSNKNIFMGVGNKDEIVPLEFASQLSKLLSKDKVVFQIYDTAHASTVDMLNDAYNFLKKTRLS